MLYKSFPKPLLLLFTKGINTTPHPTYGHALILKGVGAYAYMSVFDWFLENQKAKKELGWYTEGSDKPYFKATRALQAARELKSSRTESAILEAMKKLEYGMEMVKEIRVIYKSGPTLEVRDRIGKQIAAVMRLRWFVAYDGIVTQLRREIEDLDEDIIASDNARLLEYQKNR